MSSGFWDISWPSANDMPFAVKTSNPLLLGHLSILILARLLAFHAAVLYKLNLSMLAMYKNSCFLCRCIQMKISHPVVPYTSILLFLSERQTTEFFGPGTTCPSLNDLRKTFWILLRPLSFCHASRSIVCLFFLRVNTLAKFILVSVGLTRIFLSNNPFTVLCSRKYKYAP